MVAIRRGYRWLAAGTILNFLYRVPFFNLFLRVFCVIVPFCLSFCFVLCSRWSFGDAPLIFSCPADHVLDWQPRIILLGLAEARSINVKNVGFSPTFY